MRRVHLLVARGAIQGISDASPLAATRQFSSLPVSEPEAQKQQAESLARITSKLGRGPTPFLLNRTTSFLVKHGVDKTKALQILARSPSLITCTPEVMERQLDWMRDCGLTPAMRTRALISHPGFLASSLEKCNAVRDWFLEQDVAPEKIPFILSTFPQALSGSIHDNLAPKLEVLREMGLSQEQIVLVLHKFPRVFCLSEEGMWKNVHYMEQRGVDPEGIVKIVHHVPEFLARKTSSVHAQLEMLDELFGPGAGIQAMTNHPRILMSNSGELRRAFNFLVEVVGFSPERLGSNIGLIMRNVDNILKPRAEFLRTEGVHLLRATYWISDSNPKFVGRHPEYEAYALAHGGS